MPHNLHPIIVSHIRREVIRQGEELPEDVSERTKSSLLNSFYWGETKEGHSFWSLGESPNFEELYFQRYPNATTPDKISLNIKFIK
jgi:hypothetical protein